MSYLKRFRSVFSTVEIELASSLPVCNTNDEILFFYTTQPNDDTSFIIESICHVFKRDFQTGSIIDITSSILHMINDNAYRGSIIRPLLLGKKAYEMEDLYNEVYEEYFQQVSKKVYDVSFSDTCRRLMSSFNALIPDGALRMLYTEIGSDYFTMLQKWGTL